MCLERCGEKYMDSRQNFIILCHKDLKQSLQKGRLVCRWSPLQQPNTQEELFLR